MGGAISARLWWCHVIIVFRRCTRKRSIRGSLVSSPSVSVLSVELERNWFVARGLRADLFPVKAELSQELNLFLILFFCISFTINFVELC